MKKTQHPNRVQANIYYKPGQFQLGNPLAVVINLANLELEQVEEKGTHIVVPLPNCAPLKLAESLVDLAAFKAHWDNLPATIKEKYTQKHVGQDVFLADGVEPQVQANGGGVIRVATKTKKANIPLPSNKGWPSAPGSFGR